MRGRLEVMRSIVASYCEERNSGISSEQGRGSLRCKIELVNLKIRGCLEGGWTQKVSMELFDLSRA